MPACRRHYFDYPDAYEHWHFIASLGSYIFAAGMIFFVFVNLYAYFIRKEPAGNNPWGAGATTLEWTLPSPPPFHQYEVLPRIAGGDH